MLLSSTSSPFFCPLLKFSSLQRKSTYISKFQNGTINSRLTNFGKVKFETGIPCRKLHHPRELEFRFQEESDGENGGIGIHEFYMGKNIFITGATGLVGKAFVEKLLRSTSVGTIYLLMKAKDKEAAQERLQRDIIDSDLFQSLREKHGSSYEAFVMEKLKPVLGNLCEPNLGMDVDSARAILEQVDVIVNSAASTTLNERYDVLLEENVNAPQRLMRIAKACKNLKVFVHLSTAYVAGRKEGLILEKPLVMGENRRRENDDNELISSLSYRLDVTDEINLATKICKASTAGHDITKDLKRLGLERAAYYGWYNTYHSTKAMAEMVLDEIKGDVPLLIIRPTVIESTYQEPFPGWIQGNRMYDPVIIAYGKGQLPGYLGDPQGHMDIVPVDMVVNTTIAAIAKHGISTNPSTRVYHAATGIMNPLTFLEFFDYIHEYFTSYPLMGSETIAKVNFFKEFSAFSNYMRGGNGTDITSDRKLQRQHKVKVAYAEHLLKMYEFLGFINSRFDTANTRNLLDEMSEEERVVFDVDATKIDWKKYFTELHIPGLRKHVLGNMARIGV